MDHNEPQWRINSSFSPPLPRRWDCRFHHDGLPRVTTGPAIYRSSAALQGRGSRNAIRSERYLNHHHSVSDGALSFYSSSSDNCQVPRWTPPIQRYDLGEFSTPSGAKPEDSVFSQSNEKRYMSRAPSVSSSPGSPSPLSEPRQWVSTSMPIFFPPNTFSGRRPFMSKPVYPLIYGNPISDGEIYAIGGSSNTTPRGILSPDMKFHQALTQLQRMEASSDPNTSSSRREGFRWSNASSYDFGFDGDAVEMTEQIGLHARGSPYIISSARHHKCALCERPLWQKSTRSAHSIVRSSDMPVSGILPCRHVFHAECLEETTPKSHVHEPPCPVCNGAASSSGSIGKSLGTNVSADGAGSSGSPNPDWSEGDTRRSQSLSTQRRSGSLLKSHFKKRFPFKGKTGKDLFGAKTFGKDASSSSSSLNKHDQPGRLRFAKS